MTEWTFGLRWFALWIGVYVDRPNRTLYVCPFPMCVLELRWGLELPPTATDDANAARDDEAVLKERESMKDLKNAVERDVARLDWLDDDFARLEEVRLHLDASPAGSDVRTAIDALMLEDAAQEMGARDA